MEHHYFMRRVLRIIKDSGRMDLIDSFSDNQYKHKQVVLDLIDMIDEDLDKVIVIGGWFGSILVPELAKMFNQVVVIDKDREAMGIGQNRLFPELENVTWIHADIFEDGNRDHYKNPTLIINTSCEHMKPMNTLRFFEKYWKDTDFILQSNDMFNIPDHINCVNDIEEFIEQAPGRVFYKEESNDDRGTKFTIMGRSE